MRTDRLRTAERSARNAPIAPIGALNAFQVVERQPDEHRAPGRPPWILEVPTRLEDTLCEYGFLPFVFLGVYLHRAGFYSLVFRGLTHIYRMIIDSK